MVWLRVNNVSIDFPIYSGTSRSLKETFLEPGRGERMVRDGKDRMVVEALRRVSLELREGERCGLIGGNGAGKTTLLRAMAGIYEPTRGSVAAQGAIVPLFGGNLGMDGEMSGLDNIAMRGRILGLSRKQIDAQVADIADFTDLGDFLHLPVRTYSAGMRVRLAFAVTTAVDADILLLDEGLGAGDMAFRQKASARLEKFVERAGIIVLASHSDSLMRQFCNQGLWLDQGAVRARGPLDEVLEQFNEEQKRVNPDAAAAMAAAEHRAAVRRVARERRRRIALLQEKRGA